MKVRTRFAPSPTGELHLGNVRTAVLNWLVARHGHGDFVLRFEDTDVERNDAASESTILEGLDWLGLSPDEGPGVGGPFGPYRQSERRELYREHAERLLEAGAAFRCYCSPEELEARRETAFAGGRSAVYDGRCRGLAEPEEGELRDAGRLPAIRLRVEPGPIRFTDVARGAIEIDGADFGDFVILRSDGRPTYNFAVVVDDILMEITDVIRGSGHLPNTPKQVLLYRALGAPLPRFAHVPDVHAPGGAKLSKREGAAGILEFRAEGYHPDAVVNYLSLLSWGSESGEEFLTRERLIREIDLRRIGTSEVQLDLDKMRWLSGQHIRAEEPAELAAQLRPFLESSVTDLGLEDRDVEALAEIAGERIQLFPEAVELARSVFLPPRTLRGEAAEALAGPGALPALEAARARWSELGDWDRGALKDALRAAQRESGTRGRDFYHPVRAALSGRLQGPEVPDLAYLLGRRRALARLEDALTRKAP